MSRTTAAIVTAAAAVALGLTIAIAAGATLGAEGVWGPDGIARGHLDFTAAALLLVGLALLLMGLILLLATVADYWMDVQDQRDVVYEANRQHLETERYRLEASLAQTVPDVPLADVQRARVGLLRSRPRAESPRRIAH